MHPNINRDMYQLPFVTKTTIRMTATTPSRAPPTIRYNFHFCQHISFSRVTAFFSNSFAKTI